tara:strand:- start:1505 stop:1753 length:249 start_codon:yes stop_codon:yes gene_type:complete
MKYTLLIFCIAVLSACATSKEVYTADGKQGHSIECSGKGLTWGSCYEKAGELCGARGYGVLQKDEDEDAIVTGSQYGLYAVS